MTSTSPTHFTRTRCATCAIHALLVGACLAAETPIDAPPSQSTHGLDRVRPFLVEHCIDCHDAESAKGDLDLDNLRAEFSDTVTIDAWQDVLEKIETGAMPPKKKPRPRSGAVRSVSRWLRAEFAKRNIPPSIDHKRRSPEFGNHLDHEELFDGTHTGPAFSLPRLWRRSPHVYNRFIRDQGGLRHAASIHQPFAVDESKGVIADYAAQHFADSATLELLMMNCQSMAEYQTTGILKREWDGKLHRRQRTPKEFREILEAAVPPGRDQLERAVRKEYNIVLERAPTAKELASTLDFASRAIASAGRARGLQATIVSILLKPEAVYRLEIGLGPVDHHGRRRLAPFELATALAYALTDRGPIHVRVRVWLEGDAAFDQQEKRPRERTLVELAQTGRFDNRANIRRVVRRILDDNDMSVADYTMFAEDHKVRNTRVLRFFRDFFGYHHAPRVFKDEKRIGVDSGFEVEEMVEDADQLVMHIFDEDKDVLRRLLTTNEYFVAWPGSYEKFQKDLNYIRTNVNDQNFKNNEKYIARHEAKGRTPIPIEGTSTRSYVGFYNLDHETWDFPTQQPFPLPKEQRAGILTHPAWLVAWSGNFDNDPIRRGKWIREHLLAGTVPDVPITVNAVVPEDRDRTLRERLKATRAKECRGCHEKMNPLGLPFERFDDFGRYREREMLAELLSIFPERHRNERTVSIDTTGEISGTGENGLDGKVADPFELVEKLANSTRARQSFVRYAFRFWLGRNETFDDSPTLIAADRAYTENGGSMKALIASLVSSDSFLYRKISRFGLALVADAKFEHAPNAQHTMKPTRRDVLAGLSVGTIAPLLTPFLRQARAQADGDETNLPRRFLFVVKSSGLTPAELVPKDLTGKMVKPGEEEGWPEELERTSKLLDLPLAERELPESLAALSPFKDQLTILQGLSGKMCRGGHSAWYGALGCYHTGNEGSPGRAASATIDGALARALPAIFPHVGLTLGGKVLSGVKDSVVYPGISALDADRPLPFQATPAMAYRNLFGVTATGKKPKPNSRSRRCCWITSSATSRSYSARRAAPTAKSSSNTLQRSKDSKIDGAG